MSLLLCVLYAFSVCFSTLLKSRLERLLPHLGHVIFPMYGRVQPNPVYFSSIMGALNIRSQSGHLSCLP